MADSDRLGRMRGLGMTIGDAPIAKSTFVLSKYPKAKWVAWEPAGRHAERAAEPGSDPGLSVPGEVRAQSLAAALADARVDAVIATQYRRTQLTAAPLVRAAGVTPLILQTEPDVTAHARAVAEAVRGRYAGRTVLVVGHSNTVSAIIAALGGPAVLPPCDNEFANLWMLVLPPAGAVTLVRARYGAPDPPLPADCRP